MAQKKEEREKMDTDVVPVDPDAVAFQRFDAEDDQQILAEIQGRNLDILDRLVYSYSDRRGNTVTGLSLTGVRETVREMNRRGLARIRITAAPPIITETDEYVDAIVYAEDELNGGGSWGAKRQPKKTGTYLNPFALEQALSKAQRNAMFALIPAAYVVEMIKEYTEAGRSHELKTNGGRIAELPEAKRNAAQNRAPAATEAPAETPASTRGGDPITEPQVRLIRSLLQRNDLAEADMLRKLSVESLNHLTKQRASQVIDRLLERAEQMKASA